MNRIKTDVLVTSPHYIAKRKLAEMVRVRHKPKSIFHPDFIVDADINPEKRLKKGGYKI